MKILNINSYYYSSTVHNQLQKAISTHSTIKSVVYVPLVRGFIPREECLYENNENINIKISECYNKIDRCFFHIKHSKILKVMKQCFNIKEFDCMHAHSLFSNGYIAMKIKEQFKIPYIVAVRNTDLNVFYKYMFHLRSLGQKILKNADKIIFLSESYKNYLIHKYMPQKLKMEIHNKLEIIPSGIDNFWLNNTIQSIDLMHTNRIKHKEIRLVYAGRIDKNKNIPTVLKAIEILIKDGWNAVLTVVGKIVDKAEFRMIASSPHVTYIPSQPKEKLIDIYRDSDIFVMPSFTESFGLVYAEAMSQGLPVIYTRGQGFDGQFQEGEVGYHVEANSPESVAEAIKQVTEEYDLISKKAAEKAARFNWSNIVNDYDAIYKSVVQEKGC